MRTLALFECSGGHTVARPRWKPGHPECLTCGDMWWVRDIEVEDY